LKLVQSPSGNGEFPPSTWELTVEDNSGAGGEVPRRQLHLCIGDNYTRASGVAPNR
jgi:hypothetical protein